MRHEIYCQKYGVQEHNGAEYFIFLECCPPKNDWFILTLQSFPRIGVLNVKCPCFPPLLWAGRAVTSYTSHGKITQAHTLQMLLCSSGVFFCSNYRGGWEALRCKGLWGTTSFLSWSPEPWKPRCKCAPWSDQLWRGYPCVWTQWVWGCREDCSLAELILCPVKSAFSPQGACGAASCCLPACSRRDSNPSTRRLGRVAFPRCPCLPRGSPEIIESTNHC